MQPLAGKIAVVAGATRGAGRGIATALGEAGATVYCSGRSGRGRPATPGRPETIDETAELVTARGDRGIAVLVDHTVPGEVATLFARVQTEQGHIDILVNDVWGGDELTEFGKTFWQVSLAQRKTMLDRAIWSHIVTAHYGAPLMVGGERGLIVEITDGDFYGYRGNVFYDLVKTSVIRLAFALADELRKRPVTALALTPRFLRSEAMLDHCGVTEANWQDGAKQDPHFIASETPLYVGRAVAALAADPHVQRKSGRVFSSWELAREYGFMDAAGRQPHWGEHLRTTYGTPIKSCDQAFYEYWVGGPTAIVFPDWA